MDNKKEPQLDYLSGISKTQTVLASKSAITLLLLLSIIIISLPSLSELAD
tara:strand:+ start:90 stop:239 length:150 start_codon:yes stop_codon:yes gene_type:complete